MKSSSNLEAFLQAATPLLPWRSATMERFQGAPSFQGSTTMERFQGAPSSVWQQPDGKNKDAVEYFALSDLWEHYAESSVYGLAVPVRDAGDRAVVTTQHFVPYLSAVQLYTATKPTSHVLGATSRSTGSETDSWSDDSVGDRFAGSGSSSWDAVSDEDDSSSTYDGNGSPGVSAKQSGYLNFQYREWDSPYERVPLAHKVHAWPSLLAGLPELVGDSDF